MAIKLNFQKEIKVKTKTVFYALTKKNSLMEWLADSVEFNEKMTNSFVAAWKGGRTLFVTIKEKKEDEKVLYEVLTADKHRLSDFDVLLEETDGSTLVKVEHRGILEEEQDAVEDFWEKSLENLRSVLEDGIDNRVYQRPMFGVIVGELITSEIASIKNYPVDHGIVIPALVDGLGAKNAGIEPGDIMSEFNGKKILDFDVLSELAKAKLGDVFTTVIYRGDTRMEIDVTLSSLPLPKLPASVQDASDAMKKIYKKANLLLDKAMSGVSENAAEYRPAQGEWNVKEVLAHLILSTRDLFFWAAALVDGKENFIGTSLMPEKINSLITCYSTAKELRVELEKVQKESVAFLSEISGEFTSRKNSFLRLSENTKQEIMHYEEHVEQIKNNLKQAADIK